MRLLSLVVGIPTAWAACNSCPFPSLNVTAFLPCLKPVIGEDCCVTGRPLVNDPCIRVWLKNPQLAPYVGIINKAQVACNVNQLAPCAPAVAAACPTECAGSTTTSQTTSSSSSGQSGAQGGQSSQSSSSSESQNGKGKMSPNGKGQMSQSQSSSSAGPVVTTTTSSSSSSSSGAANQNMQNQNMQNQNQQMMQNQNQQMMQNQMMMQQNMNNCSACPFPNVNMTAFQQACFGSNITSACCLIRRPFVTDPCSKAWLLSPQMAPYTAQLAQAAQICNTTQDQVIPCNVSVAQACPSQCALAPNCSQVCPLPTLNMTALAPCLNSTINQTCCNVVRPMMTDPCAKAWLANPLVANIASTVLRFASVCNVSQVPVCNATIAGACPSACAVSLGLFSNHSSSNYTFGNSGAQAQNAAQAQNNASLCQTQSMQQQMACAGRMGCPVTQCNPDGSFVPMQCSGSTGQCWCVDSMGNEVANTRSRGSQPNCAMYANGMANSTIVNTTVVVNSTVVNTTTTTVRSTAGKIAKAGKRFKKAKAKANGGR